MTTEVQSDNEKCSVLAIYPIKLCTFAVGNEKNAS
mgnify:CR=1 FL=1